MPDSLIDQLIASVKEDLGDVTSRLLADEMTPAAWRRECELILRRNVYTAYGIGQGETLTAAQERTVREELNRQIGYLRGFYDDIKAGKLSDEQIAARIGMYADRLRGIEQQGEIDMLGLDLPQVPGDGGTQCLCLTSPEARVWTAQGWQQLVDVKVGDLVLTHRMRWQPVTALIIKLSVPRHRQAWVLAPSGRYVGCTEEHLWWGPNGWQDASHLGSMYALQREEVPNEAEAMQYLQGELGVDYPRRPLQIMSIGMSLREAQRLQGIGMHIVRDEPQGKGTVAGQPRNDTGRYSGSGTGATATVRRPGFLQVAAEAGRALVELVLGRRWQEAYGLPLPVGLDNAQWAYLEGPRDTPQEWSGGRRPIGELGIVDAERARKTTWGGGTSEEPDDIAAMDLPEVRRGVQTLSPWQEWKPEVLLGDVLPRGTAVYDIVVAEDHSFVVEGLVAHNTNCRCHLEFEESTRPSGRGETAVVEVRWIVDEAAEHCQDCLDKRDEWNPLVVKPGVA